MLMEYISSLIWSDIEKENNIREIKKTNTFRMIEWLESNPRQWKIPTNKRNRNMIISNKNKKLNKENKIVIV